MTQRKPIYDLLKEKYNARVMRVILNQLGVAMVHPFNTPEQQQYAAKEFIRLCYLKGEKEA